MSKVTVDIMTVEEIVVPDYDKKGKLTGGAEKKLQVEAKIDDAQFVLHCTMDEGKDLKTLATAILKTYKEKYREELMGEIKLEL